MKKLLVPTCAFALTLTLVLTAAAQKGADRYATGGGTPATDRITREVRHELVMLPYYGVFDNLAYRVEGSTVTLLGQVTNPVLKSDAERAVKGIEGVTHVNNQIHVLPLSPMDGQTRIAEYRAIYGFQGLDRYAMQAVPSIHIIVENGRVTLEGVVDTQADKDLAALRANTVAGVFSVTNNLHVAGRK
ncbi:Transport-associated [Candidatus Sulfopaludibacter sp. SbA3]|nr:Transport-associated [Candidatus Sulfopaludibacter sp. SbA3]